MDIKYIDNKGQISGGMGSLIGIAVTLVVAAIVIAFGAKITNDVGADLTGTAQAAAYNGTTAMSNLSKYLPTLATVGAAAVIIAFLLAAFTFGRR